MNVIAVMGITKTGKTTTVEALARELRKRRYSVGSVKEIHYNQFMMDTPGTNTDRHKQAGSQLVTALGLHETDILYQERLPLNKILTNYSHDFVLLEGTREFPCPKIITAATTEEIDDLLNDSVFAISGKIADQISEYKGLPVINCLTDAERLTDLVIEKAFEMLPNFDPKCCSACGVSCNEMCMKILRGEATREDCKYSQSNIKLEIDGEQVKIVAFVEKILMNTVVGLVSELDGYKKGCHIKLEIGAKRDCESE